MGPEFDLAPLIFQEVSQSDQKSNATGFGTLRATNQVVSVDSSAPAVYVNIDTVELNTRVHLRLGYLWFYAARTEEGNGLVLPIQGIRVTLDVNGRPVLWEVLADISRAEVVFVSQTLESAARAEYGPPLAGRRFAIEQNLSEEPDVVVARVVGDGPVPMGPIVYLSAGTHSVSTLICRCMPAQAKTLLDTRTYQLVSILSDKLTLPGLAKAQSKKKVSFWPGEGLTRKRLERCLRLPHSF